MDRRGYLTGAFVAVAASLACLGGAAAAQAGDRVFWAEAGRFAFANVDGSGGVQTQPTGGMTVRGVDGAVIDRATDRIYWIDIIGGETAKFLYASLDGSGGGELNIAGASNVSSASLAIDPVGRKIYWADNLAERINYAHLDGSGGGTLAIPPSKVSRPGAVAIDPVARRIYWVNESGSRVNAVSFANLDGPGEGSVPIGEAKWDSPHAAAIDPVDGRIYWADRSGDVISFANFDRSGGGDLNTAGATVDTPAGVAVDPVGGRVYWTNRSGVEGGGGVSSANVDGSGGGRNLVTRRFDGPQWPQLLFSPKPTAPPTVSGGTGPGSLLTCSNGAWSGDAPEANFYSLSEGFAFQWSRNGADLPGATNATLTSSLAGGEYRCHVIATNEIGATRAASAAHRVAPVPGSLVVSLAARKTRPGALRVAIRNTGPVDVSGSLSGRAKVKPAGKPRRFAKLAGQPFQLAPGASTVIRLPLPKPARLQLLSRRALAVELAAAFAAPGGPQQATKSALTPRLLRRQAK